MQILDSLQFHVNELAFERNDELLFSQVNFSLEVNELIQIKGANGCGKSTLLRILAGFIEPHAGAIFWKNKPVSQDKVLYQQQLRYIGHQNGIKPLLTVFENIQLSTIFYGKKATSQEVKAVIEKVNLSHLMYSYAQYLSAGQLRRLSLARLLLNPAPLWILDEPTTALDIEGQHVFADILNEHLNQNGIAIVATHQDLLLARKTKTLFLGES